MKYIYKWHHNNTENKNFETQIKYENAFDIVFIKIRRDKLKQIARCDIGDGEKNNWNKLVPNLLAICQLRSSWINTRNSKSTFSSYNSASHSQFTQYLPNAFLGTYPVSGKFRPNGRSKIIFVVTEKFRTEWKCGYCIRATHTTFS